MGATLCRARKKKEECEADCFDVDDAPSCKEAADLVQDYTVEDEAMVQSIKALLATKSVMKDSDDVLLAIKREQEQVDGNRKRQVVDAYKRSGNRVMVRHRGEDDEEYCLTRMRDGSVKFAHCYRSNNQLWDVRNKKLWKDGECARISGSTMEMRTVEGECTAFEADGSLRTEEDGKCLHRGIATRGRTFKEIMKGSNDECAEGDIQRPVVYDSRGNAFATATRKAMVDFKDINFDTYLKDNFFRLPKQTVQRRKTGTWDYWHNFHTYENIHDKWRFKAEVKGFTNELVPDSRFPRVATNASPHITFEKTTGDHRLRYPKLITHDDLSDVIKDDWRRGHAGRAYMYYRVPFMNVPTKICERPTEFEVVAEACDGTETLRYADRMEPKEMSEEDQEALLDQYLTAYGAKGMAMWKEVVSNPSLEETDYCGGSKFRRFSAVEKERMDTGLLADNWRTYTSSLEDEDCVYAERFRDKYEHPCIFDGLDDVKCYAPVLFETAKYNPEEIRRQEEERRAKEAEIQRAREEAERKKREAASAPIKTRTIVIEIKAEAVKNAGSASPFYIQFSIDKQKTWSAPDPGSQVAIKLRQPEKNGLPADNSNTVASLFSNGIKEGETIRKTYEIDVRTRHMRLIHGGDDVALMEYYKVNFGRRKNGLSWEGRFRKFGMHYRKDFMTYQGESYVFYF